MNVCDAFLAVCLESRLAVSVDAVAKTVSAKTYPTDCGAFDRRREGTTHSMTCCLDGTRERREGKKDAVFGHVKFISFPPRATSVCVSIRFRFRRDGGHRRTTRPHAPTLVSAPYPSLMSDRTQFSKRQLDYTRIGRTGIKRLNSRKFIYAERAIIRVLTISQTRKKLNRLRKVNPLNGHFGIGTNYVSVGAKTN